MGKGRSKSRARRSPASLPRGIPQRGGGTAGTSSSSPFDRAAAGGFAGAAGGGGGGGGGGKGGRRAKHHVHNRPVPSSSTDRNAQSKLAESLARRKAGLVASLAREGKANEFVDRRIGEGGRGRGGGGGGGGKGGGGGERAEDAMLRRVVRERARRSQKREKFRLDGDDDDDGDEGGGLTHRGRAIDDSYDGVPLDAADVPLSDSDDAGDDLDRVDTMLHFGGGKFDRDADAKERDAYGMGGGGGKDDLGRAYRSRREELEERIARKKFEKAEKMKRKEDQVETFETMDESFAELAQLLQFRDKEQERVKKVEARKEGTLSRDDKEMDAWDKEMKEYLFERKVAATDRTKPPEELAKEEAERLHALESKRLARMSGDFLSEDEFSDVSDDEEEGGGKRKRRRGKKGNKDREPKKKRRSSDRANPEELSDSDGDDAKGKGGGHEVRFTADGLVYVDERGNVVGKVGDEDKADEGEDSDDDSSDDVASDGDEGSSGKEKDEKRRRDLGNSDDEASADETSSDGEEDRSVGDEGEFSAADLKEGTAVQGNYRAAEQYGNKRNWYNGTITAARKDANGNPVYDVTYEDGDVEEGMTVDNVRPMPKSKEEKREDRAKQSEATLAKKKKQKAKLRAKEAIPFVFEVPTTLDALHDLIANHAATGSDASLIIQRIHATNSVRLNHKNKEKMQNFYDVLLRRFIAVGDAIFASGDGGEDLGRYDQLDSLTKVLYSMSQDSPECAGAVWSRRLGIFQKALSKRLRDVEVTPLGDACNDGEFTAWPSTGMLLLMRALPHIFPSTDKRHAIVTPAILLLGQILAQTPIKTRYDVVMGFFCSGLMLEYTKGAKRLAPEALAYLAGVLRLFADDVELVVGNSPLPSLGNASKCPQLMNLRKSLSALSDSGTKNKVNLSLEKEDIQSDTAPLAILSSTLHLTQQAFTIIGKSDEGSEREMFGEILKSLLLINGKHKDLPLPQSVKSALAETARIASGTCASDSARRPLQRRKGASVKELAIKTLAPRMEDPSRYSMSKDKGKTQLQAEHDRNRREYKREHKAAMREFRLDSAFIESERRKAKNKSDTKAREKRHKNFSWLEQEQATMNQQVRQGGGLLSGGGVGAAKAKAKSGKMGIKKGGKF
ncbi:hypothetical protein ACHAWF_008236 [Thalassiosira exigua]